MVGIAQPPGELDLAPDRDAPRRGLGQERRRRLPARRGDENVNVVGLRNVAPFTDQSAALRFVAFIDRVYDAQLPIRATGAALDTVFPDEMLAGGYRKKYLRAVSRLIASTAA